jgi:hypothetical protein
MKKLTIVVLMIASLFRTETIWAGVPAYPELMFGDKQYIHYDAERHLWENTNSIDMWLMEAISRERDPIKKAKLQETYQIPEQKKTIIVLRSDAARKQEFWYAQAFAVAALQQQKRRFVLINVESAVHAVTSDSDRQFRTWPHLGILYVGTVAYEEGYEVVLWDELVQGNADLTKLVQPGDVVGLSLVVTGIERGVELAHQSKQLGASMVIAGNDSAAFRVEQILALPGKPIDAVFASNSITPIREFFRQGVLPTGGNRSNEFVVLIREHQARHQGREDAFIVPKFDLFTQEYWNEVWGNYTKVFGHKHCSTENLRNAIALLAQGCTRTRGTDVCSYCTIADVANIQIPSEEYLRRTLEAYNEFGIKMVFNTTDSSYEMTPLVKRLQNIGAHFDSLIIYGRAQGITQNPALLEKWLSMVDDRFLINVGMDSGDDRILAQGVVKSSLGKGSRLEENIAAVHRIKESGAHLHYSLIFGSPGETRDSCDRNMEFLEWSIATLGHQLDLVETDVYWLNYGAPVSRVFHDFEYAQQLAAIAGKTINRQEWQQDFARHSNELVVPDGVERAWYRHFTNIDFDTAQEYNKRCAEIMARHEGSIAGRKVKWLGAYKPSNKEDV